MARPAGHRVSNLNVALVSAHARRARQQGLRFVSRAVDAADAAQEISAAATPSSQPAPANSNGAGSSTAAAAAADQPTTAAEAAAAGPSATSWEGSGTGEEEADDWVGQKPFSWRDIDWGERWVGWLVGVCWLL